MRASTLSGAGEASPRCSRRGPRRGSPRVHRIHRHGIRGESLPSVSAAARQPSWSRYASRWPHSPTTVGAPGWTTPRRPALTPRAQRTLSRSPRSHDGFSTRALNRDWLFPKYTIVAINFAYIRLSLLRNSCLKCWNRVKPELYESELYEILDFTNFLPGPGEIPSYTLKVWVVRKSELYECFRRSLAIRITHVRLYSTTETILP